MKAFSVLVLVALATCTSAPAAADDPVDVGTSKNGFLASLTHEFDGSHTGGHADVPVVDLGTVLFDGFCTGTNWTGGCSPAAAAPTLTPGDVERAFRELPLPAAELSVQPPNGRTLVNFRTNFFTEQGEFTRTVTLLGRQVELRIWPASFTWRFGDGATQSSTSPGAAYPDLEITHKYARTGRVGPSVDVTYAAQFRVGDGPWRDVAGTVTIPGGAQQLQVVEARPVLVGG